MRFLAFSDLHGNEAAFEKLKILSKDYDYAFLCGDLTAGHQFANSILEAFPNGFIIPGNCDSKASIDVFSNSPQWLHEKRFDLGEINLVGFGYSPPTPFGTYGELSDEEIYSKMSRLPIDSNTILLLHAPPKGYFDEVRSVNTGSQSILRIIQEKKPLAALFGHIHEHEGVKKLGKTMLVKLPPANHMKACSLSYQDKNLEAQFIKL